MIDNVSEMIPMIRLICLQVRRINRLRLEKGCNNFYE